MIALSQLVAVMVGGAAGSVLRFLVGLWAGKQWGVEFPYGTMLINVSGCFVLGFVGTLVGEKGAFGPHLRLLLTVGFAGGYTTFSTFGFETFALLERGNMALAGLNIAGNMFYGLIAVYLGMILARLL
ncbi:MAG: fluoride efflux transporter CrcB [Nitrospinota bacterium]|nr:MAG: fluoride efflux transporter CrcB [Nitrospinota bacterium]